MDTRPQIVNAVDELSLVGPISATMLRDLPRATAIRRLLVTADKASGAQGLTQIFTAAIARGLAGLCSVDQLWLWLEATPAALRHVFAIPGLRVLDVMGIAHPGQLAGFADTEIEQFRCNSGTGGVGLRESDFIEIAKSTRLKELGAHSSKISLRAMAGIIAMPQLQSLDLEDSCFDDAMATLLKNNTSLHSLDLGLTKLSGKGLAQICSMKNLRSLDLWASRITQDDLDLLAGLPLEYLSIGQVDDERFPRFSINTVMKKLATLPALKRIWLDGLELNAEHLAEFKRRKISVRQ